MTNICECCQLCSPTAGCTKLKNESCLKEAIKLIKPSATNGEVMQMLFPDETKTSDIGLVNEYGNAIHRTYINGVTDFTADWWNRKWGE